MNPQQPTPATATTPPPPASAQWAWFLDVDGTLLEIAAAPDRVIVADGLVASLARLHASSGGALALVTGRPIDEIDGLFKPQRFAVAGQHGLERRAADGVIHRHASNTQWLDQVRHQLAAWVALHEGTLLENKGFTVAIHYRAAPHWGEEAERMLRNILSQSNGAYVLQAGKMVWELRPAGRDKGGAVLEYLDEAPFRGRQPIFVGDDVTDEYAFAAVMGRGGHGVKVGAGATVADWRLPDVASVRTWFEGLGGGQGA